MAAGIIMYLWLTLSYLDIIYMYYDPIPGQPCYLGDLVCGIFQSDAWGIYLAIWTGFNLLWSLALLFIQLYQIAIGKTTNETSSRRHKHAHPTSTADRIIQSIPGIAVGGIGGSTGDESSSAGVTEADGRNFSKTQRKLSPFAVALPCLALFLGNRRHHHNHHHHHNHNHHHHHHGHGHGAARSLEEGAGAEHDDGTRHPPPPSFDFGILNNCQGFWTQDRRGPLAGIDWDSEIDTEKWHTTDLDYTREESHELEAIRAGPQA
ncbi:palmitoyltransferase akr1 [Spiromyces aspiralis]|uniref:Palmitoyltransferase akr1 n=1 Tax=Spiromyces aspiralis TaxID=68401 RepID=A0ACC1HDT3_9FUNG|nr:palmitoyltransferase akr1 [Spiromyces aspiralis]